MGAWLAEQSSSPFRKADAIFKRAFIKLSPHRASCHNHHSPGRAHQGKPRQCSPVAEAGLVHAAVELASLGHPSVRPAASGEARELQGDCGLWVLAAEGRPRCRDGGPVSSMHILRDAPEMLGGSKTPQLHPGGMGWGQLGPGHSS